MAGDGGGGLGDGARAALRLAAAAAAVGGLVWFLRRQLSDGGDRASSDKELEELIPVLEDMARALFLDCQDIAASTKTVHAKIDVEQPALAGQLKELWQSRAVERLSKTQLDVASRANRSAEELAALQERHYNDERVRRHVMGCTTMLEDTLQGRMPVLPGAEDLVPEGFTEDKVIDILKEALALEAKKIKKAWHRMRGKQQKVTARDIEACTAISRKDALQEALAKSWPAFASRSEVFLSTVNLFSRSPAFAQRKAKVEEALRQTPPWVVMMAATGGGRASPQAAAAAAEAAEAAGLLSRMGVTPQTLPQ